MSQGSGTNPSKQPFRSSLPCTHGINRMIVSLGNVFDNAGKLLILLHLLLMCTCLFNTLVMMRDGI